MMKPCNALNDEGLTTFTNSMQKVSSRVAESVRDLSFGKLLLGFIRKVRKLELFGDVKPRFCRVVCGAVFGTPQIRPRVEHSGLSMNLRTYPGTLQTKRGELSAGRVPSNLVKL